MPVPTTAPATRTEFRLALALEVEIIRARRDVALARASRNRAELATAQTVLSRLLQVSYRSSEVVR